MSKTSRLKRRKRKVPRVPWGIKKNETALHAFQRQATKLASQDQTSLNKRGWAPLEAALEAWETMHATN